LDEKRRFRLSVCYVAALSRNPAFGPRRERACCSSAETFAEQHRL